MKAEDAKSHQDWTLLLGKPLQDLVVVLLLVMSPPYAAELLCIVTQVCLLLVPVYLFMGLMMMYLLLRTLHKMADLHGLTTFLQLPRCEESDQDEDREPIVETERDAVPPYQVERTTSEALDPGSQSSYNTINRD